jgi:hypothetical protein
MKKELKKARGKTKKRMTNELKEDYNKIVGFLLFAVVKHFNK